MKLALEILAAWTIAPIPLAIFVGRFIRSNQRARQAEARELADRALEWGEFLPFHADGDTRA